MSYSIGRLKRLNFKINSVEVTLESHWDLPEISWSEVVRNQFAKKEAVQNLLIEVFQKAGDEGMIMDVKGVTEGDACESL